MKWALRLGCARLGDCQCLSTNGNRAHAADSIRVGIDIVIDDSIADAVGCRCKGNERIVTDSSPVAISKESVDLHGRRAARCLDLEPSWVESVSTLRFVGNESDRRFKIQARRVREIVKADRQEVLANVKQPGIGCRKLRGRVYEIPFLFNERLASERDAIEDALRDIVRKYRH